MQKIAYIFPGQGAQYIGMGQDLYEKYQEARDIFDTANAALGFDLKKICFEGPKEELVRTDISQPAILTVSIAALKALEQGTRDEGRGTRDEGRGTRDEIQAAAAAGLSLGEYSALVAAGVIPFEDAVRIVRLRGEFMQEAA